MKIGKCWNLCLSAISDCLKASTFSIGIEFIHSNSCTTWKQLLMMLSSNGDRTLNMKHCVVAKWLFATHNNILRHANENENKNDNENNVYHIIDLLVIFSFISELNVVQVIWKWFCWPQYHYWNVLPNIICNNRNETKRNQSRLGNEIAYKFLIFVEIGLAWKTKQIIVDC